MSLNSINVFKVNFACEELESSSFNIRELDLQYFFTFKMFSDYLLIFMKISKCSKRIKATVTVGTAITYIQSVVKDLKTAISGDDGCRFSLKNSPYIRDNVFKIKFEIAFTHLDVVHLKNSRRCKERHGYAAENLFKNFETILSNQTHCDVTFLIGDKKLPAHKVLLHGRSRVFAELFEHQITTENVVKIDDVKHEVFGEMLKYIYTNNSEQIPNMAEELLVAAEKYQIVDLKELCVEYLEETLSQSTVIQTIMLSNLHNLYELKETCLKFIMNNYSAVDTSSLLENPKLLNEILKYTLNNKV